MRLVGDITFGKTMMMKELISRKFAGDLKAFLQSGKTMDDSLRHLRTKGASPVECIIAVKEHSGCSLTDAKRINAASQTWQDVVKATEKTWDDLIDDDAKSSRTDGCNRC